MQAQSAIVTAACCKEKRLSSRAFLTLRYSYAALPVAAGGPTNVGQRISQNALRTCIAGDFHFAALESRGRAVLGLLRKIPDVTQFRGCLVDLARLAEYLLQHAHRLTHIVSGNLRHRANRISGAAAAGQNRRT